MNEENLEYYEFESSKVKFILNLKIFLLILLRNFLLLSILKQDKNIYYLKRKSIIKEC